MESLLLERYNGERVGQKHSGCSELRAWLDENQQQSEDWLVLMGVRNPFDSLVSKWLKLKSNHKGRKSSDMALQIEFNAISFETWVQSQLVNPNFASNQLKKYMPCTTAAIRFERMQDDWAAFCETHQLPFAEIPRVNPTQKRQDERDFRTFYTRALIEKLTPHFASYMNQWGYHPPNLSSDHD